MPGDEALRCRYRNLAQTRSAACPAPSSTAGQRTTSRRRFERLATGNVPLSVRGGGHDWAGRALCDGLVIDLRGMNGVVVGPDKRTARILAGRPLRGRRRGHGRTSRRPRDRLGWRGRHGGLTLGGGYGALIGRFGLALDNLARRRGRLSRMGASSSPPTTNEEQLFWALRGGGGNFGVVTAMHHRLHDLPSVRSGMLIYPVRRSQGRPRALRRHCGFHA